LTDTYIANNPYNPLPPPFSLEYTIKATLL